MATLPNPRHELFAQAIAKGASQRDAYKAAGYAVKSDKGADASASRLLTQANLQARIAELQTRAAEKTMLSKSWVIQRLMENVERAMQAILVLDANGNPTGQFKYEGNVANRALELLGKEQRMFVDRKEIGKPGAFDALDDEELERAIELLHAEVAEYEQKLLPPLKKET
jgi:phage terminase small subunit